jgi:hypothetical protein
MADQVDLELAAEIVEWLELERPGFDDAGVVDKPRQAALGDDLLDRLRRSGDHRWVCDVDHQRRHGPVRRAPRRLGVLLTPDACEDVEPQVRETVHGGGADPSRRPCDNDGAAVGALILSHRELLLGSIPSAAARATAVGRSLDCGRSARSVRG